MVSFLKCPFCAKEFDYTERPALASQALRRHVVSCPTATREQRAQAVRALLQSTDAVITQTLSAPR
jgi:hypothetical protein